MPSQQCLCCMSFAFLGNNMAGQRHPTIQTPGHEGDRRKPNLSLPKPPTRQRPQRPPRLARHRSSMTWPQTINRMPDPANTPHKENGQAPQPSIWPAKARRGGFGLLFLCFPLRRGILYRLLKRREDFLKRDGAKTEAGTDEEGDNYGRDYDGEPGRRRERGKGRERQRRSFCEGRCHYEEHASDDSYSDCSGQ